MVVVDGGHQAEGGDMVNVEVPFVPPSEEVPSV